MNSKKLMQSRNQWALNVHFQYWFAAFLGLFLMLIFAGYPLLASIIFSVYSLATSFFGQFVFLKLTKREEFNFLELLGRGIAVGTIVPAALNFFIQTYSDLHQFIALLIFLSLAISAMGRSRAVDVSINYEKGFEITSLTIAATTFSFAQFSQVFYIPGLIVLLLNFFGKQKIIHGVWNSKRSNTTFLGLIFSSTLLSVWFFEKLTSSPPIWRQLTYIDQLFDETQSWSIAKYGFNENAFAVGHSMPGHTLTHSWAGLVQAVLNSQSFLASGSAGILLALLGTCALLGGFAFRTQKKISSIMGVFLIWIFQMSISDQFGVAPNPRIANSLSLLWFLFTILLILEMKANHLRSPYLLIPLFIALTGFSKIHWAFFLLVCFGVVAIYELVVSRTPRSLFISIISSISMLIIYALYIFGLNAYATFAIYFSISNFLLYSAVLFNRSLGIFSSDGSTEQLYLQKLFTVAFLFFPLFIALTGTTNQQTYFISCSLLIIALIQGPHLIKALMAMWNLGIIVRLFLGFIFLFTLGISIAATGFYWKVFEGASKSNIGKQLFSLVNHVEIYVALICIFLSLMLYVFLALNRNERRTRSFFITILVALLFIANTSAFLAQSTRTMITDRLYGRQLSELALSDEQIAVGDWIRRNSAPDSIVATNHYCQVFVGVNQRVPISPEDCRQKNMNAWLSAISQRRIYFEAPIVSIFGPGKVLSAEDVELFNLSLRIGQSPTNLDLLLLENTGVDLFVAENETSSITEFAKLRKIVFSNSSYTVFQLNPNVP
jgi:hypothetical protein